MLSDVFYEDIHLINSFDYILWYQSNTKEQDKLIIDNRIISDKDSIDKVIRYIFPYKESSSPNWKQLKFLYSHKSSLECFHDKSNNYLFKSHFKEKDNLGRLIPFVMCISSKDFDSALYIMKDITNKNKMSLLTEDLRILDSYKSLRKKYYLKIICRIIFVLIPICVFLIKLFLQDSNCE